MVSKLERCLQDHEKTLTLLLLKFVVSFTLRICCQVFCTCREEGSPGASEAFTAISSAKHQRSITTHLMKHRGLESGFSNADTRGRQDMGRDCRTKLNNDSDDEATVWDDGIEEARREGRSAAILQNVCQRLVTLIAHV